MRMLMNNLDADVAERPQDLVVTAERGGQHGVGRRTTPSSRP